jgi:hypothetical protein
MGMISVCWINSCAAVSPAGPAPMMIAVRIFVKYRTFMKKSHLNYEYGKMRYIKLPGADISLFSGIKKQVKTNQPLTVNKWLI